MNPTNKQCSEIAKATKAICDFSGSGHHVVVWLDFSWEEAVNSNSVTGRDKYGSDEIERPIADLPHPMSAATVRQMIESAISWRATIDPATIPDAVLASERARRNAARRKTFGAGTGRPKIMRQCPKCGADMSTSELRRHRC